MNQATPKKLVLASFVGALSSIALPAAAQDCPTCCHADRSDYECAIPDPVCSVDGVEEEYDCSIYPGLTFAEREGKILEISWNGIQPNGDPPQNAFAFGFAADGSIACQLVVGPFVRGVERLVTTSPNECSQATTWVYDANGG
jgi:hypothetical protein